MKATNQRLQFCAVSVDFRSATRIHPNQRFTRTPKTNSRGTHASNKERRNMKTRNTNQTLSALALKPAVAALALLMATLTAPAAGRNPNPGILPVGSASYGKTLGEWSGVWWTLGIEHPVAGNPFIEGGAFELSKSVWSLAAPLGSGTFEVTIPAGKALFLPAITIECSNLEPPPFHGDTEEEQAACAKFWADHIVDLSFEIDGVPVQNLASYR